MRSARSFFVAPARELGEASFAQDAPDGGGAERLVLLAQGPHDVVDGEVLLAQGDDLLVQPHGVGREFGRLRAPGKVAVGQEKGPLRILSELMTQHAKAPRRVTELFGRLL